MNIVPIRDLKDTSKIENLCSETKAPVFITKNGYGKLVIMDIETFERLMRNVYEAKKVNEGIEEVENDNVKDGKEVIDALKQKYGF